MMLGDVRSNCYDDEEGLPIAITQSGDNVMSRETDEGNSDSQDSDRTVRRAVMKTETSSTVQDLEETQLARLRPLDETQLIQYQDGDSVCEYLRQLALTGTSVLHPGAEIKALNSWAHGFGLFRGIVVV